MAKIIKNVKPCYLCNFWPSGLIGLRDIPPEKDIVITHLPVGTEFVVCTHVDGLIAVQYGSIRITLTEEEVELFSKKDIFIVSLLGDFFDG